MDEDLGLSDREKELKKWNAPYVYREFPKMLYRGSVQTDGGRVSVEQRIVVNASDEILALGLGWDPNPEHASQAEHTRQAAIGVAAAERAYQDRRLSPAAQAEAADVDGGTGRHLGEIPVRPRRRTAKAALKPPTLEP